MINTETQNFTDVRVFYHKISRAKYISHLDITRLMQRSLKRSKLNIWYTQGYNPHLYVSFALPLSLGYESHYEAMDLRLVDNTLDFDEIKNIIDDALPLDIVVKKVCYPVEKTTKITSAEYEVLLYSKDFANTELQATLEEILSQDTINVMKKSKKGVNEIDIKPDINVTNIKCTDNNVTFTFKAVAGVDKNVNPSLLIDVITKKLSPSEIFSKVTRKMIYVLDEQFI